MLVLCQGDTGMRCLLHICLCLPLCLLCTSRRLRLLFLVLMHAIL